MTLRLFFIAVFGADRKMLDSLVMEEWSFEERSQRAGTSAGPRPYDTFTPTEQKRWKLVPFDIRGGFEDWPALDELFGIAIQGINPNRGLQRSVVEMDKGALEQRIRDYFSDMPDADFRTSHPELFAPRARYIPETVRSRLKELVSFDEEKIVPYVIFPLDARWLYYETSSKFLNEARAELWRNLKQNTFLVAVPEPRQYSEIRPLLLSSAFDLHVHDRGSVAFPVEIEQLSPDSGPLFEEPTRSPSRISNLAGNVWAVLKAAWSLRGDLSGADARKLGGQIAALCIAVCHSPGYEAEHKEALAHDWAHVPIPKDRDLFLKLAVIGSSVGALLNPLSSVTKLIKETLGDALKTLGVPHSTAGTVRPSDLTVEYSFFGAAAGGWRPRPAEPGELLHSALGDSTGDLFINERVCLRNVPRLVWQYELGGYPVIKKWLGYRDRGHRGNQTLSIQEMNYLRNMVHRISALLVLHSGLDQLYEAASKDSFTTDELTQSNSLNSQAPFPAG